MNTLKKEIIFLVNNCYEIILPALLASGVALLLSKTFRRDSSKKDSIPGNLGLPFFGEIFSFLSAVNSTKGCYDFVRVRRQWHGNWFKTRILGKIHVFIPSMVGAKTVLSNDFGLFNKGYVKSMADAVGKKSLLCVPQETHKRMRRLLADPFSMNSLSKFVQKFDQMLLQRLQKIEEKGKSFRLLDFTMKLTFDAMCEMLISVTDDSLLGQLQQDCAAISEAMLSFPVMIPGTRYYKGIKARKRVMKVFETMIAQRRSGNDSTEDFLQSMLQKDSLPADEKLDDSEIMDNLLTLIVAGQTTTAAAMMWSLKFLDENREAQNRLREEQLSLHRNKPNGALLTLEDLNMMSYASKVLKETLRMANVLLWFPRVALSDCKIEGIEIKKGWHVNVDATYIHYDPAIYNDPMQFNPSRFDEMQKPYSYIPFGSGPRTCMGNNMAKVILLVFFHRVTSGYMWIVDDSDPSLEERAHIPRLKSGCPITLTVLKDEKHM